MDVLDGLLARTWLAPSHSERPALERAVNEQVLAALLALCKNPDATMQVRAQTLWALEEIATRTPEFATDPDWRAHFRAARRLAEEALEAPLSEDWSAPKPPPGSPIGLK